MAVLLREGSEVLVTQAVEDGQVRSGSPIVLNEGIVHPGAEVVAGVSELDGGGLRETKQKIRKVESRVSNGKTVGSEAAGRIAAESESPARIGVRQKVLLDPPQLAPHSDVVLAHVAKKNIHGPEGLITREGRYAKFSAPKFVNRRAGKPQSRGSVAIP